MGKIVMLVLAAGLVVARIGWLVWKGRTRAEADQVGAALRWAINRRLGGESFPSVQVTPRTLWQPGRVVVSGLSGAEPSAADEIWSAIVERLPAGYDLIVRLLRPRLVERGGEAEEYPHAA